METFAPSGADATEIALGPLCTMVAQPLSAPHAPIVATKIIPFNIRSPGFDLVFNSRVITRIHSSFRSQRIALVVVPTAHRIPLTRCLRLQGGEGCSLSRHLCRAL
jgi:hypothetical protein